MSDLELGLQAPPRQAILRPRAKPTHNIACNTLPCTFTRMGLPPNYRPLILHLRSRWGRVSIAAACLLMVAAVLPTGIQTGHRLHQAVEQAVVDAPLSTLASLAHLAPQDLENRLKAHGLAATMQQSARDLAERNGVDEREVIAIAFTNE